jgi:hypothetical protein
MAIVLTHTCSDEHLPRTALSELFLLLATTHSLFGEASVVVSLRRLLSRTTTETDVRSREYFGLDGAGVHASPGASRCRCSTRTARAWEHLLIGSGWLP